MVYQRKRKTPTSNESLNGKVGDHADFHEHAVEKPNTSRKIADKTKQHTSNHNEINKLLMLSEVCMVEISSKEKASGKSIAELCESQKDEVALKNKGKEPFSSGPKQGADNTPPSSMNMIGQNLKHTTKMDNWSELELDALWIGVRRFGQHNWTAIVADPGMCILKKRTPQELETKWKAETLKIFPAVNNTVLPIPTTCANTTNALGQGIGRFPFGVDNEALRRRWSNMFLSKNQGPASSFPSIQRAATATASSFHSIQRAATAQRLEAIQTFAELNVSTRRQEGSTSTNAHQPQQQLQFGHHFLLYNIEAQLKSFKEHPLQIRSRDDSSHNK